MTKDKIKEAVKPIEEETKTFWNKTVEFTQRHSGKIKIGIGIAAGVAGTLILAFLSREVEFTDDNQEVFETLEEDGSEISEV